MILSGRGGEITWNGEALEGWQTVEGETRVYVFMEPEMMPSKVDTASRAVSASPCRSVRTTVSV